MCRTRAAARSGLGWYWAMTSAAVGPAVGLPSGSSSRLRQTTSASSRPASAVVSLLFPM